MHWFDRVLFAAIAVVTFFVAGLYFDAHEIFYFPREPFDFKGNPLRFIKYIAYGCVAVAPFQKRALTATLLLALVWALVVFLFFEEAYLTGFFARSCTP
ncbi:MAG: hypothetical protein IJM64_09140 [Ottowia sp.]|nr:hypothetical protein [Ottowia sp.]